MGALIRAIDWSQTSLGPISQWPQSLRSAISICLGSKFPIVLWWGPQLVMIYNDGYRPMLGATKHPAAMGQTARECWPEIWHVIGPMLEGTVMRDGEATWSEDQLLLLDRNGYLEECYFTFSYSPIRDESGGVGGVFCAVTETTAQVIGERRLRTLRELADEVAHASTPEEACLQAARILESNPTDLPFALLYLASEDGREARLVSSCGLAADTLASPSLVSLAEPVARGGWPLAQVAQSGESQLVGDLLAQFGDLPAGGVWDRPPTQSLVLPIVASSGPSPVGMLVVGLDPYRVLDEEYQGFLNLLAGSIGTAIANARAYIEERKRVEALAELDRAKTTFFSNISHEFRTPLTLMLAPIEESLAEDQSPPERERLELIHRNGLRLQKLVNTLLDFSRIEAGRIRASYEPTDLALLTRDLVSVFRSAVEKAGLRLLVDCPPLSEPIYVDRDKWEQIVLNLLSNAFKFTLEGEIAVTLYETEEAVALRIRDTGSGISAEQLPYIFERFHRVEGTRARTQEGTGIGLAFVSELVKLHGGTISVESLYGQGSEFTITLPKGKAHLPSDRVGSGRPQNSTTAQANYYVEEMMRWLDNSAAEKVGETGPNGFTATAGDSKSAVKAGQHNGWRIVLADDNADMRDYVRRLLAGKYDVEAVADGMAALDAVRRRPADLLITDVMMPRLDGFGLLHAIRADNELKTLPVILLSARAGEEAKVEGLDAGADDYLVKPFSARELLARVDTQFELARIRREAMQALRTSEARYRALVHSSTNSLYRLSADGTQLLEVSTDGSFVPIPEGTSSLVMLQENLHPDDQERVYQAWLACVATQTPYEMEHRGRQADGSWGWMQSRTVPVRNDTNQVVEWIGSTTDITARKRAEESLRQAEERLRLAIEAGKIFTWEVDPTTRRVTYSANVKEVMGFPLQDVTSADRNLVHPDDQAFIADHFVRVLRGEINYNAEHRFVNPENGEVVWVRAQGLLVRDAQGDRARLVGITQNITERKKTEEALRQRAEEFQAHFNLTAVGSVQADAESGRLLLVNRAMCDFTGYSEDELLERTIWEITDPKDREENEARFGELVRGEIASFELEKRFKRKDGKLRWGLVSVTIAQRDNEGKPLRTGSVVLDITERKRADEALRQLNETLERRVQERTEQVRESERRFRALVDASAQIVWTMDAQGRVVEDSPSWRVFTGQSYEEGKEWGWMNAVHPDDRELALLKWRQAVANAAPMDTELRIHRVGGEWHWMQVRAVPLRDEKGLMRGWVGMNIDIHERKQAEADRERLARSLLMAEQEERRRISQVLHDDLQQLLYATQMRIATVGQDLQAAGQDALMDEIEEARQWLRQCIETTRQMTVELSPPILKNEGLAEAIEWLKPQMERLHGLKVLIDAEHSYRVADEDLRALLFQIVRELLFNVAKHAGVERAVVELDQEENHLVIRVIDEGRGFDQKEIGESKQQKGGFGLFSVQERLRLVGGRMEIHSQVGVGTKVVVHAPMSPARLG